MNKIKIDSYRLTYHQKGVDVHFIIHNQALGLYLIEITRKKDALNKIVCCTKVVQDMEMQEEMK